MSEIARRARFVIPGKGLVTTILAVILSLATTPFFASLARARPQLDWIQLGSLTEPAFLLIGLALSYLVWWVVLSIVLSII